MMRCVICQCALLEHSILGNTMCILTLLGHPDFQALLQPTVLAAVAGDFVDDAVLLPVASVHHVFLDASPKEALCDRKTGR